MAEEKLTRRLAEMRIIGSVLIKPDLITRIPLSPESFMYETHSILWRHLQEIREKRKWVDITSLLESLRRSGHYQLCGAPAYLAEILEATTDVSNVMQYVAFTAATALGIYPQCDEEATDG